MVGKAGLKAGLIGIAVMLALTFVNHFLVPTDNIALSFVLCGVSVTIYAGIGVLAGLFLHPTRTPGKGAGAGAIAGALSGLIIGVAGYILVVTGISPILDSPQMQQAIEQGVNPMMSIAIGAVCNPALGAGAAAVGGAILAAVRPD